MDLSTDRICPNEPDIASKIMDGEAILINLQTGAYYSLRDAGAVIWHALAGHRTQAEILDAVAAHYGAPPASLASDVADLLVQLQAEQLVRQSDKAHTATGDQPAPALSTDYQKPVLEKFTDMEELLALDPPTPGALDGLMRRPLS